jgi:cytochrome P450
MTPTQLCIFVALFPAFLFVFDWLKEFRYRRQNAKNNCKPPVYISDYPLGIRSVLKIDKAHKRNEFYSFTREMIDLVGKKTFRHQTVGGVPVLTIDPENVKAILATQFKEFDLGGRHSEFQPLMGDGIFTLSGDGWHHSRTLLRPQFTNEQVSRLHDIEQHTQTLLSIFKEQSAQGKPFDCQPYFFKLTLDTATEFLFGESTDTLSLGRKADPRLAKSEEFADAFNTGQTWLLYRAIAQSLHSFVTSKEYKSCTKVCHDFVDHYVQRALETAKKRDADEKDFDAERYIFLDQLTKETRDPILMRDQALNILLAGRDTTAGLLSFTISLLVRHKEVWKKLREAVMTEFGETTDNISFQTLKRCEYLKHVVNETLRLYPIVPVNARRANCNTTLPRGGGPDEMDPIYIEKGTNVQYCTYALQRNKEFWGDDSDEFRPERWMEGKKVIPWTYIPFNGGPRICLGQQFALTEASYVLVRIVQTFSDVSSTPDVVGSPIKQYATLTTSVADGVPVVFKE